MSVIDQPITELEEPVVIDEAGQLLLDAANLIQEHGLAKGQYFDDAGRYCTLGALQQARFSLGQPGLIYINDAYDRMLKAIFDTGCYTINSIVNWNDNRMRTKEEVVSMLRKAATTRS